MNNSLVTLCIVFSLFYLTSARSVLTYRQIFVELDNLTTVFNREINCNSTLVPKLGKTMNVSAAEISCGALESLKMVCRSEQKHLSALKKYLAFVKAQAKTNRIVKCEVSDEEQDIISFLESLRSYFRFKIFNH